MKKKVGLFLTAVLVSCSGGNGTPDLIKTYTYDSNGSELTYTYDSDADGNPNEITTHSGWIYFK